MSVQEVYIICFKMMDTETLCINVFAPKVWESKPVFTRKHAANQYLSHKLVGCQCPSKIFRVITELLDCITCCFEKNQHFDTLLIRKHTY